MFFDIFYSFRDIRVQRTAKINPLPKLGGNNIPVVLVREVLDLTPIATYTVIFIQSGQLFRKISTGKLFRTHRQVGTHRDTRQAKKQFFWRFSVISVRQCA